MHLTEAHDHFSSLILNVQIIKCGPTLQYTYYCFAASNAPISLPLWQLFASKVIFFSFLLRKYLFPFEGRALTARLYLLKYKIGSMHFYLFMYFFVVNLIGMIHMLLFYNMLILMPNCLLRKWFILWKVLYIYTFAKSRLVLANLLVLFCYYYFFN